MIQNNLWFIYAFGAAILWGLQYATAEQLLKTIPAPTLTLIYTVANAMIYVIVFLLFRIELNLDQIKIWTTKNLILVGLIVLVSCLSNLLIFSVIAQSTATKASLIEITYPFFVAIFATIIYKEGAITWQTLIGGMLIFSGVVTVLRS